MSIVAFASKDWTQIQGPGVGQYSIISIQRGRKHLLSLNGRAIGILSDVNELRRLAETDYKQRTGATEDHG